ncbi:stem-specific protein TSJT1 [Fagus crenata]
MLHCFSNSQQYGLNKTANEVVVRDIHGKFGFILYDSTDADGSVPFFWGNDSEGHLVLSDDAEIVKKGCGKSFAPFPKGLRSFEHLLNEVKPVPRVDSSGQVWCNFHLGCRDLRGNLLACQQELEVLPTGPQTTDLVNVFLCSTAVVISGWALLSISLFLIILP